MKVTQRIAPVTFIAGTVTPGASYVCSDADRDRFLASAEATDDARTITRPTGEPRRLDQSQAQVQGWSGRQQAASQQLAGYWHAALPLRGLPGSFSGGKRGGGEISADEAEVAQAAWDAYCGAMDRVKSRCSPRHEHWLRQVVIHEGAAPLGSLHLLRESLDFLADEFGLDWRGRKR